MKFKTILPFLLVLALTAGVFTSCGGNKEEPVSNEPAALSAPINIATLNGPTGMGMAQLMDSPNKYNITVYQSPDEIVGKIVTGEVDFAAVPSNLAAVLYNKTKGQVVAISPITLGVLYIVENGQSIVSINDLKDKTIIASGKGGAPEYILGKLLKDAGLDPAKDVTVKWLASHMDVNASLLAEPGTIAMLPEPFVTVAQSKGDIKRSLDLNELWTESTKQPLPMGVLVGQKKFVEERSADLAIFKTDYAASVSFVNAKTPEGLAAAADMVSNKGFIANTSTAEKAIPFCNICFYQDDGSKELLMSFYKILFDLDPKSVGGKLPNEDFYYSPAK